MSVCACGLRVLSVFVRVDLEFCLLSVCVDMEFCLWSVCVDTELLLLGFLGLFFCVCVCGHRGFFSFFFLVSVC